jgi:endo-1,4-beta-xylanase
MRRFGRPYGAVRLLLALALPFLLAASASPPRLREAAERARMLMGTAVRAYALSDPAYSHTLNREFNLIEPEDAMKWWIVRRNQGEFDFQQADQIVRFAQIHGMKIRGHCLVWDHDNPKWLNETRFTPDQLSHLLHEHISTVVKHYCGQVFAWDVVNEAFDERGRLRESRWYNQPGIGLSANGTAYIEQAFLWAHEADPNAILFYNEAGAEGMNVKSDAVYEMVKDFKSRGVPIGGIGLQMHVSGLDFNAEPVAKNIARITALGLQVHITELDVSLPLDGSGQIRVDDLTRQAEIYRAVLRACLQHKGCTAIQTWGFTDKYSWIGSHSHGTRGGALLFDRDYKPKPVYRAVIDEISSCAVPAR